jgi:uncharacterized protein
LSDLDTKLNRLRDRLCELGRLAIAYSGGVDSTLLLKVAVDTLGPENVLAITADSPVTTAAERERAAAMAQSMGAQHLIVPSSEFDEPDFVANPPDRCYVCKHIRFSQLRELAEARGFVHLADGTNVDDAGDYRPGLRAAEELGVLSPLRDAGLGKADIRQISRALGLPTADLPSFACLASRVPYGTPLSEATLRRIEAGEQVLAGLGLRQYRLRDHGDVARIEVPPDQIPAVAERRSEVTAALKGLGYRYVALDLEGYRTGSMNEVLT